MSEEKYLFTNVVRSTHNNSLGQFVLKPSGIQYKSTTDTKAKKFQKDNIAKVGWVRCGHSCTLNLFLKSDDEYERFDGFRAKDMATFVHMFREHFGLTLEEAKLSTYGINAGTINLENSRKVLELSLEGETMLEVPYSQVTQCAVPGKNEIELQFQDDDTGPREDEALVGMRFHIPPTEDDVDNSAYYQNIVIDKADIKGVTGNVICSLREDIGAFLTPRGKYMVDMYDKFLRMNGKTYNYKIMYKSISRMFLLPKPNHTALVISLDDPISQGAQRYPHLVMNLARRHDTLYLNLPREELKEKYNDQLSETMEGALPDLVAKVFKVMTGRKVFIPGDFLSVDGLKCVRCALKASQGLLFPLQRSFFFIHKPATFIRFDDILSLEFLRYNAANKASNRNFDIEIVCRPSGTDAKNDVYQFANIKKEEYKTLYHFLSSKPITIKNKAKAEADANGTSLLDGDRLKRMQGEESSDDSDFLAGDSSSSEDESVDEKDFSEEDLDYESGDGDPDAPKRKRKKKKGGPNKKKPRYDPLAPKRPLSEYMLFNQEMNPKLRAEDPTLPITEVSKKVGKLWKTLDSDSKAKYAEMHEKAKQDYEAALANYIPSVGYDKRGKLIKENEPKTKKEKDPSKPKPARSAYAYFYAAMREQNKFEGTPQEVTKKIGAAWKEIEDSEKEKYEAKAVEDKKRHKAEMKSWEAKGGKTDAKPKGKKKLKKEEDSSDSSNSSASSGISSDSDSD
mmetsp:Transcript_11268/g.14700  ORF Transcript_11268/g.14700 Transcript_11268/m.14700 type:complete len:736 (+) Transcript_11268:97-2304(+)|eukprot:CAMPEP_0184006882 /NCGR_PEP_ID=MMETSP0954-20121128/976_1 /TAXON_ID=627963 /ORGANISM="Aplanochytrium sp, Strain PBS07" /LENGTH=735 /DNA_ID=CAMNT_0026285553 /DNA_START=91 /DNA_END=2298 /DNA_ORIENTATION=+